MSQLVPCPITWLWPSRLAQGKLAMLDGDPGRGKSLVALDLCARLSTGWPWPDGSPAAEPGRALVLNGEDGSEDTIVPRLRALGADLDRIFVFRRPGYPMKDRLSHAELTLGNHSHVDPSGVPEIHELAAAGFRVTPGQNAVRLGIEGVTRRLRSGLLRVVAGRCPNLLHEASLYCYSAEPGDRSEEPVKAHDHALDALRYLVGSIDRRRMASPRPGEKPPPGAPPPSPPPRVPEAEPEEPKLTIWDLMKIERLWTRYPF